MKTFKNTKSHRVDLDIRPDRSDPWLRLAAAVLIDACRLGQDGDPMAILWLGSDDLAGEIAAALGLNYDAPFLKALEYIESPLLELSKGS